MSPTPNSAMAGLRQTIADLQRQLAEARAERDESEAQKAAITEVLGVINSSPGDLIPVFDAILEKAHSLCGADKGSLTTYDGEHFRTVATRGLSEPYVTMLRAQAKPPGSPPDRLLRGELFVHLPDVGTLDFPIPRAAAAIEGVRTVVYLPLRKNNALLGYITAYRQEVRPFTDKQIALLQNFSAQAVIAMENARLLTETREALEQQTATAEVLGVINSSPGDLAPVFEAILDKAHTLCEASHGALGTYDGQHFRMVAGHGLPEEFAGLLRQPFPAYAGSPQQALIDGAPYVHILDQTASEQTNPIGRASVRLTGSRTLLFIPLRRDDALVGYMSAYRREVRPFSDRQIALLQNFAAQAVIAMGNARLLTETREALEQQTATAEVLQVINSSPGNLAPVFDAILEKAHALCGAAHGALMTYDGEFFRAAALHDMAEPLASWLQQPFRPAPGDVRERLLQGERLIHIADIRSLGLANPESQAALDAGVRTLLVVPLRKDGALLGYITANRREVRPFTDSQIALLQNFAAQAVIAMENARLLTETREALEQQTATAEVLGVINSSPGDLAPVFEAILEKAHSLCGVSFGSLQLYDGGNLRAVAVHGLSDIFADMLRQGYRAADSPASRPLLDGNRFVHIADCAEIDHPVFRTAGERGGIRTVLFVPLRRDSALLGLISSARQEVRPFSDKEIALLENFAAQAVIAIENARLLGELRERTRDLEESLEYQTATSDVLQLISRSTFDLQPVLDALTETGARLCLAEQAYMTRREDDAYRFVTAGGATPEATANAIRFKEEVLDGRTFVAGRGTITGRVLSEGRAVQIIDAAADPEYTLSEIVTVAKIRTIIGVPLMREGEPIGTFNLARQRVEPFTERQIELVRTFADQAVIAIENTRLINETREALEQQTATAEVLQVINSSPGDLAPVFDAILEKAHSLCGADHGSLTVYDGQHFYAVATRGMPEAFATVLRRPRAASDLLQERLLAGEGLVHIPDLAANPTRDGGVNDVTAAGVELGIRTLLFVALRKDGALLGYIAAHRREVSPFSEKQIALLQNFAAQAVIAMENARLLGEIRQRQQELRVTFDNMADGVAMFDEALHLAAWNRNFQELLQLPDEFLAQPHGFDDFIRFLTNRSEFGEIDPETQIKRLRERIGDHYSFERTRPDGKVVEVRNNPMPNGGVVVIYSDITERKRSEEEIRAARDAAEAAYRDLKAAQANLIQAEKMASLGQLTAGIAHEIKNPLNFVNNFAGLSVELLDELKETAAPAIAALDEGKRAELDGTMELLTGNLEKIAEHGKRADNIVKSMLEHSRGVSGERREVDLNGLVDEALNLAYHGARAQDQSFNIMLERDYAQSLKPIEVAPQEMTRVFLNLFGNGFYAATKRAKSHGEAGDRPTLRVTTSETKDGIEVRVRDNGTGIPAEVRDKLFQPFFTTKPTGEGTGLGLSISYDIVTQQHGGTIMVESEPDAFTEFTVRLPRKQQASV
jgi:two-component system, NtrC family, sensor kinase